jgi:hypothetical protein
MFWNRSVVVYFSTATKCPLRGASWSIITPPFIFTVILKEMSGSDAKFLDAIINAILTAPPGATSASKIFAFGELLRIYQRANALSGKDRGGLNMSMDLLERNRIIVVENTPMSIDVQDVIRRVPAGNFPSQVPVKVNQYFRITELGMFFVASCRAPLPSSAAGAQGEA